MKAPLSDKQVKTLVVVGYAGIVLAYSVLLYVKFQSLNNKKS
jgi:hypothetical protein